MRPKAATSSRPSGAAATCCASRTISTSASPPDQVYLRAVRSLLPDWTPPQMAGFLFWWSRHWRRCECGDDVRALRHAQSRAGIPAGTRIIALATDAIVALVDDAKRRRIGIEGGIEEADRLAARGVRHRNQCGP